ncbi:potassium transporter Trk [Microbacterium sp.]|uniref:potassium transporter Trk n=1 Tax=Microbacterium sp. TaxID=51671 RepID=UPI0025E9CBF1|nr:potassium transporter Trk [Microbacterium sp.]
MADQPRTPDASASTAPAHDGGPAELIEERLETVTVRRAPKFAVFLVLGAALGLVVAMILTFSFNDADAVSPDTGLVYSSGQVFGFLALACGTVGVVVGGLVALLLDRTIGRRTRQVVADRESVTTVD